MIYYLSLIKKWKSGQIAVLCYASIYAKPDNVFCNTSYLYGHIKDLRKLSILRVTYDNVTICILLYGCNISTDV